MKRITDKSELKAAGIAKLSDRCKLMSAVREFTMKHNINYDDFARKVNIAFSIHLLYNKYECIIST